MKRLGSLEVIERIFGAVTVWLAPILVFTAEEAWGSRHPEGGSVHLELFPEIPLDFLNPDLAAHWAELRKLRSVVTGAIEIERAAKAIGSSLEAHPVLYLEDGKWREALGDLDFAEVCITSDLTIIDGPAPEGAFRHSDAPGAAVWLSAPRGSNARAPGAISIPQPPTPNTPM